MQAAAHVGQRLCEAVAALDIAHAPCHRERGRGGRLGAGWGVAACPRQDGE
jgi:hypothetical protein